MSEPRSLSIEELFPPEGHRYLSDERLQELRDVAVNGGDMTLTGLEVLQMICDIRNAEQELKHARGLTASFDQFAGLASRIRVVNVGEWAEGRAPQTQHESRL